MSKQSAIFIGVDGGGTSTKAIAKDLHGNTLGEAISGPSNPNNSSSEKAARNIASALSELGLTELTASESSIVCGIAGLANPEITDSLRNDLLGELPHLANAKLYLTHDLEIAHYAAFQNQPGLLILAGTGSACYAKLPAGETKRISGRSEKFNDPGSGYAIGKQAIDLRLLDKPEIQSRESIAQLAPLVLSLAAEGSPLAKGILQTEARQLISLVTPLAAEFSESLRISLSGSILATPTVFREMFLEMLKSEFPQSSIVEPNCPPQQAAVQMARARLS